MNKLKIGVLVHDFNAPAWAFKMIERIVQSDFAEVRLVVKKKKSVLPATSFLKKLGRLDKYSLYKVYKKYEAKAFKVSPDAFEQKDLSTFIGSVPVIEVTCNNAPGAEVISKKDVAVIGDYSIDVFIKLGFGDLRGDILTAARLGIWSFHHGDNFQYRGGPAGFWEFFKRERGIGSILEILTEDIDGGQVLFRSWSTIHSTQVETLNSYYWKSSLFVFRKLNELHRLGAEAFVKKLQSQNDDLLFYSKQLYTLPRNRSFLKLLTTHVLHKTYFKIWKRFNFEQWILLYAFSKDDSPTNALYSYKRITPPKDRFWADPCVIYDQGRYFVFFEEYFLKNYKGHISVLEIDETGKVLSTQNVLEKAYHLSYPFVFTYQDSFYMIPETAENSTIELYKAKSFPLEWELEKVLMNNVKAFDTTIYVDEHGVWMFTNIAEIEGAPVNDELFLFSSNELVSDDWNAHPGNPIVSDVRSARSAGKLFKHHDKLYRPSQDCSYRYGHSTVINEVLILNEEEYKERKVSAISPDWAADMVGTHTLSHENKLTVIDGLIKRTKLGSMLLFFMTDVNSMNLIFI